MPFTANLCPTLAHREQLHWLLECGWKRDRIQQRRAKQFVLCGSEAGGENGMSYKDFYIMGGTCNR